MTWSSVPEARREELSTRAVSRRIGIYYFYLLIRLLTGNKITDPTSGYRIVNRKIG
ncbi:hypothetical protein P7H22_20050 [Paenibacillus larvae]|nr:hypothetical protein [Paenibacillus larvae]MDT2242166.1 hypothetical protein [Paenibacillus larvae]